MTNAAFEVILYVADQGAAREFYRAVLGLDPVLDVPGMTEFEVSPGVVLGLVPGADMAALVPGIEPGSGARAELYLRRGDGVDLLGRIAEAGGTVLGGFEDRSWGDTVAYALDLDGHVLGIALEDVRDGAEAARPPAVGVTITAQQPEWERATEDLIRDSFWDLYRPGAHEHLIYHRLRRSSAWVPDLDLVAFDGDRVVGQAIATRAATSADPDADLLVVGPVSVASDLRTRGIGAALVEGVLEEARRLGYVGAILYGNPDYYQRFGFVDAETFGITTPEGENFPAFMAVELAPGILFDIAGSLIEDDAWRVVQEEVDAFDGSFASREKHVR